MGTQCSSSNAGQRGELQHSQGLPTQFAQGVVARPLISRHATPAPPGMAYAARTAEGAGLGNRFAQQVDQRVVDARVADASGSEKKPHNSLLVYIVALRVE